MPALEPEAVRDLAARLREAGTGSDWSEVARLDACLNDWIKGLQSQSVVETSTEMAEALREVAIAHAQVQEMTHDALDGLAERMVALQTEHAAGRAYAQQEGVE